MSMRGVPGGGAMPHRTTARIETTTKPASPIARQRPSRRQCPLPALPRSAGEGDWCDEAGATTLAAGAGRRGGCGRGTGERDGELGELAGGGIDAHRAAMLLD